MLPFWALSSRDGGPYSRWQKEGRVRPRVAVIIRPILSVSPFVISYRSRCMWGLLWRGSSPCHFQKWIRKWLSLHILHILLDGHSWLGGLMRCPGWVCLTVASSTVTDNGVNNVDFYVVDNIPMKVLQERGLGRFDWTPSGWSTCLAIIETTLCTVESDSTVSWVRGLNVSSVTDGVCWTQVVQFWQVVSVKFVRLIFILEHTVQSNVINLLHLLLLGAWLSLMTCYFVLNFESHGDKSKDDVHVHVSIISTCMDQCFLPQTSAAPFQTPHLFASLW